jgi:cytochrome o ubiquinol oxidase operon protein cyoD
MSEHPRGKNEEHGTTRSYIIGFVLSLIFTAIPYYLVVNKTISGSALLAVILGIAVLQMFIQIIFFLHLGRGPKPLYNVVFFGFTTVTILVVVVGSIWIMNHLNYNMVPTEISKKLIEKEGITELDGVKTGACEGVHTTHKVTISEGKVSPNHITAGYCDRLTFINEDSTVREIAFGSHPLHGSYAGETDIALRNGRPKTIILNQSGTYEYHDHHDPDVGGHFTVLEP